MPQALGVQSSAGLQTVPECLIQQVWAGAWEPALLAGLQVVPRRQSGPQLRQHGFSTLSPRQHGFSTLSTELLVGVFRNVERQVHLGSNRESKTALMPKLTLTEGSN